MARKWTGAWEGGRTTEDRKGNTIWVIETMRGGERYTISLDRAKVASDRQARAEFALFERDPVAYAANVRTAKAPAFSGGVPAITTDLVSKFIDARVSDPEQPITKSHGDDLARYLANWGERLQGKDLRTISLAEYQAHVEALGLPRHHIKALRSFTKWLRKTGKLQSSQDNSRDLAIPQARHRRAKPDFRTPTVEEVEKIYAAMKARDYLPTRAYPESKREAVLADLKEGMSWATIAEKHGVASGTISSWKSRLKEDDEKSTARKTERQACRDVFLLRACTGMHHTEVERVARGDWPVVAVQGQGEIAGVVKFIHKSGLDHTQGLPKKALEAAKRLQAQGRAPDDKLMATAISEAAKVAGVTAFPPTLLRHFFISSAKNCGRRVKPVSGGVSREEIAAVVGHASVKTTGIYDSADLPDAMIVLPTRFENDEDPS